LKHGTHTILSVAMEVLSYFMRNPQAADNLEGITRWRLQDELLRRKVEETRQALAWLVERGFLSENALGRAGPIFTLNPAKIGEAREFLSSGDTAAGGSEKE
jgi:hypothetical protein